MPATHAPVILDHVAIGVPDIDAVPAFVEGQLGAERFASGPGGGYRFWQWTFAGGGKLEILQPDGPTGGFLHRFLEARGPGVHHVTFKVPDLGAAAERAGDLGYDIVGYDDSVPGWKEAFLHPKQAHGVVVQLAQSDSSISVPFRAPAFPSETPRAADPARLVGLRLVANDAATARRQWEELLGGACSGAENALEFRWPDSPLRIAVEIDATAEEGPRAVEVASAARLALPEGPHPVLGAAFVQVRS